MGNSTSSVALPVPPPSDSYLKHHRHHQATPPAVIPAPVNKVLPVPALPDQRALLRSTQNGAILHQGGTISGRRYSIGALHASDERLHVVEESLDMGSPQQHRRRHTMGSTTSKGGGIRDKKDSNPNLSDGSPEAKNRRPKKQQFFGSEPDLRAPKPSHQQPQMRPPRLRKKYRAPAPPPTHALEGKTARGSPQRARLFRTRAETQQVTSSARALHEVHSKSPVVAARSSWREGETERSSWRLEAEVVRRSWRGGEVERSSWRDGEERRKSWRGREEEMVKREEQASNNGKWLSSPEFQAELIRVTLNRGMRKASSDPRTSSGRGKEKSAIKENVRASPPFKDQKSSDVKATGNVEQQTWKPKSQPEKAKESSQVAAPTPFYFGMEAEDTRARDHEQERDNVERFAAQLRRVRGNESWSRGEDEWRRSEEDEDAEESGIDLCLRPTLPKKQPQVPRFSPVAAWRLLGSSTATHFPEQDVLLAEGLLPEKVVASAAAEGSGVIDLEPRGEKSADSGISGDASPGPGIPVSRGAPSSPTVWTPQQDLAEDESSSEGSPVNVPHPPHVLYLSLSLPRTADYTVWRSSAPRGRETSLDKIRRSVSGAIFGRTEEGFSAGEGRPLDDNWSLGRCGVRADGGQMSSGEGVEGGCRGRVVYLPRGPLSPSQRCHSLDLLGGEILAGGAEAPMGCKEGWEEDAVRRVEEDFERNRALDRARLRVQLRALNEAEASTDRSLGYGPSSLPADVRYDAEGEARVTSSAGEEPPPASSSPPPPSSSSSPLPSSSPSPSPARRRRGPPPTGAGPKLARKEWRREAKRAPPPPTRVLSEFRQQRRDYREPPKSPLGGSGAAAHQHIRHPSVVCDIPKSGDLRQESCINSSSPDLIQKTDCMQNGRASASSTPSLTKASNTRTPSDNYRRDFAHGSLLTPLQDEDSEKEKRTNHRNPRSITPIGKHDNVPVELNTQSNASSASSSCSIGAVRRGKCSNGGNSIDGTSRDAPSDARRNLENGSGSDNLSGAKSKGPLFTSLQPYTPGKGYRPISFNPGNQTQKLAQSVS